MATFGTRLMTWLHGERVGTDVFGNRYYRAKPRAGYRRERRWVIYQGADEASQVPPTWHGWLHHIADERPDGEPQQWPWQKAHVANLTGTAAAYRPPGSVLQGGKRAAATGDYEPWIPS